MCGIAGVWDRTGGTGPGHSCHLAEAMAGRLHHRGPDDEGSWVDDRGGPALAFRRLAIVDPTPTGHQPMRSRDARWHVVFNGEIYGHDRVRAELEAAGVAFRGTSDTETMVEAIARWGLVRAIDRLDGMFAIAAWDQRDRQLHLIRDRLGEKPLLYGDLGGRLVFASELRAFAALPGFGIEIDLDALCLYLRHGYIPAPFSIDQRIRKLEAGCHAVFDADGRRATRRYWDLVSVVESRAPHRSGRHDPMAEADALDAALLDAVGARLLADVPLGAFLSSGVDSTAVVAAMAAVSTGSVSTFTVSFPESGDADEASGARRTSQALGTRHTEVVLTEREVAGSCPDALAALDEPFGDPAAVSNYVVAGAARGLVTVALSGDGGDEVFGGYRRYQQAARLHGRLERVPSVVRAGTSALALRAGSRRVPARWSDQLLKAAALLRGGRPELHALADQWPQPSRVAPALAGVTCPDVAAGRDGEDLGFVERLMLEDGLVSLPEQMLTKVDRTSMAHALEVRSPLVAPGVVERAWSMPFDVRVGAHGKAVLRDVVSRRVHLPSAPKRGFDPPLGVWLRGPLRPWATDLIAAPSTSLLSQPVVDRVWSLVLAGDDREVRRLWNVLALRAWSRSNSLGEVL